MAVKSTKSSGTQPGDRRVAGQGPDDQQVPGPRTIRSRPASATSATCRRAPSRFPPNIKGEPWANLGVNVNDNFTPIYIVPPGKTQADQAAQGPARRTPDALYLATDEDREGEAISWHLLRDAQAEGARPSAGVPRDHQGRDPGGPRPVRASIDDGLVRAQETRRILDRLYGYEVSPLLWRKVRPKLSAGRVQSVAVRLIVERERRADGVRLGHVVGPARHVRQADRRDARGRRWCRVDGRRIPAGKDFDPATGKLKNAELAAARRAGRGERWPSGFAAASSASPSLEDKPYTIEAVSRRSPPARCSRKPTASSASPPGGRCRSPRACTRTATSPTCVPTRPTWRRWRSTTARDLVRTQYGQRVPARRAARLSDRR